ncbi:MAG: hypothetical protein Q8R18_04460 [bacterium]|nr:hypothetical protein [bacterium]
MNTIDRVLLGILGTSIGVTCISSKYAYPIFQKLSAVVEDYVEYEQKKDTLYKTVSLEANIDKNSFTDRQEWYLVYRDLDIHFDYYSSNPQKDLSVLDFERWLKEQRGMLYK